jgi:hypothetical protein
MCEQPYKRTGPRGCKAYVEKGYSLEGVTLPSSVVSLKDHGYSNIEEIKLCRSPKTRLWAKIIARRDDVVSK